VWLHPCCSRTIGDIVEIGELLTDPVSALVVKLPLTRTSHELSAPTTSVLIQQQLVYLEKDCELEILYCNVRIILPKLNELHLLCRDLFFHIVCIVET